MYNPLKQGRDSRGQFAGATGVEIGLLKAANVKFHVSSIADIRGGGQYSPYLRSITVSRRGSGEHVHEVGHALDHALGQPVGQVPIKPGATRYWSDSGLRGALKSDLKKIRSTTPRRLRGSPFDPEQAWSHAASSEREAFAHAFRALRQPKYDLTINNFRFEDNFPKTIKAVKLRLGKIGHR